MQSDAPREDGDAMLVGRILSARRPCWQEYSVDASRLSLQCVWQATGDDGSSRGSLTHCVPFTYRV